jgi:NAD(P)H-hydrate repair Nnr-like enzyme with NAD(P)H-hydrate epimerase domain
METSKTYVFNPEGSGNNGGMMSLIAPLLQQRGVDPNVLLAMKGNSPIAHLFIEVPAIVAKVCNHPFRLHIVCVKWYFVSSHNKSF